jgi:hypothetical protein
MERVRMSKKDRIKNRYELRDRFPSQDETEYAEQYSHGPSTAGQTHQYYKEFPK